MVGTITCTIFHLTWCQWHLDQTWREQITTSEIIWRQLTLAYMTNRPASRTYPSQRFWIHKVHIILKSVGLRWFFKPRAGLTLLWDGLIEEIRAGTKGKTSNTFSQGLCFNWSDRRGQLRLGHFLPPMRRSVFPQSNPRLSRPGHYRRAMTLPQLTPRSPCPCKLLTPMTTELRTTANWCMM